MLFYVQRLFGLDCEDCVKLYKIRTHDRVIEPIKFRDFFNVHKKHVLVS